MIFKPAHKQDDLKKAPGQIRNDVSHLAVRPERPQDVTLSDYIERKTRHDSFNAVAAENKKTWGEWYFEYTKNNPAFSMQLTGEIVIALQHCWKTAQENK
jgi:hypothetical protein